MKITIKNRKQIDFRKLGFETARETSDIEKTKQVCAQDLCAYEQSLQPDIEHHQRGIESNAAKRNALCVQLYGNPDDPTSDKKMLAQAKLIKVLVVVLTAVFIVSIAAHAYRFILFGLALLTAILLGVVATFFVAGVGYLAFEKLLQKHKAVQAAIIAVAMLLLIGGMFQLAQAGGIAMVKTQLSAAETSAPYVDDSSTAAPVPEPDAPAQSAQKRVEELLSSAVTKILVSADLVLGLLLGIVILKHNDENYTTWRHIGQLEKEIDEMKWKLNHLLGMVEISQRECMAGILRFFHSQRPQPPSYFKEEGACVLLVLALLGAAAAHAQVVTRQEGILIDVSGSIGAGGANNELFHEYLAGVRQLLLTEPPSSRVVVSLITTESFGSTRELLKGWTPAARGIFTDDLNRARHELASAFETKAASVTPIAAGTDIIGALWRMKALLESGAPTNASVEREIWIFSDMMNETPALPIPALLASGPEKMLGHAKANGLLVPLKGYKIHVVGASTRGLSPQAWNAIKEFWSAYFQAAGAQLLGYAAESSADRND